MKANAWTQVAGWFLVGAACFYTARQFADVFALCVVGGLYAMSRIVVLERRYFREEKDW